MEFIISAVLALLLCSFELSKYIILFIIFSITFAILKMFFSKRIKKMRKSVILQIGPSLEDKGGMVTVMEQIVSSRLKKEYNIIHIPTYIVGDKYKLFIKAIFKFVLYKIQYNVELVHIHTASNGSFFRKSIFVRLCNLTKTKVILHAHGAGFKEFYEKTNKKEYIKSTLNKVDKLIVLSESWKEFYSTLMNSEKIEVIYNSMDIPENIQKSKNEVTQGLFLGRLGKRKGTYDLIDAVEKLSKENVKLKITLAGDGEIEKVKNVIQEKKLEQYFEVVGWIGKERKQELLKSSDFLVLPSYNEGLPMAVLEAMSRKLLVISTYVGGIPEVIRDKENGLLIEPGNIEQLTSSLKIAINDKLKCDEMAEKAYQTVNSNFNEKDMINNIEMIYKALIYKNIKLCLTSSAGGHFMQLKQLFKMANKYDWFIVTEKNTISMQLKNKYKMKFLIQQERKSVDFIFKFGLNILKSIWIIYSQNPDVIISTGAGATYVLCKLVKLTGGKVIFSESFAKIKSPTVTGQKVYKFADDFYVQWPEMLKFYPNAKYKGGIY